MTPGLAWMSSVAVPPTRFGVEIDGEVERDMGDARFERLGVAVDVDRVGAGQDRRDRRAAAALSARAAVARLAGGEQQRRSGGDQRTKMQGKLLSRIRQRPYRCC